MPGEETNDGIKERLDDFIKLSLAGQPIRLEVTVYRNLVKQLSRSESTDDILDETDMCLLMADFKRAPGVRDTPQRVTKIYALCPINEKEIEAKITQNIANERLRMDYARLKEARVQFEAKYF